MRTITDCSRCSRVTGIKASGGFSGTRGGGSSVSASLAYALCNRQQPCQGCRSRATTGAVGRMLLYYNDLRHQPRLGAPATTSSHHGKMRAKSTNVSQNALLRPEECCVEYVAASGPRAGAPLADSGKLRFGAGAQPSPRLASWRSSMRMAVPASPTISSWATMPAAVASSSTCSSTNQSSIWRVA